MVNAQREECIPTVSRDLGTFRLHNKCPHSGGKPIYNYISRTRTPAGLGTSHNSTTNAERTRWEASTRRSAREEHKQAGSIDP